MSPESAFPEIVVITVSALPPPSVARSGAVAPGRIPAPRPPSARAGTPVRIPSPRVPSDAAGRPAGRHRAALARRSRARKAWTIAGRAGSLATLASLLVVSGAVAGLFDGIDPTGPAAEVAATTLR